MTELLLALAAALAAFALVVSALALAWRARRGEPPVAVPAEAGRGELVQDLTQALDRALAEQRRLQVLEELGASLDLDDLVERTLELARALSNVDASSLSIDVGERLPFVASSGLDAGERALPPLGLTPEAPVPRAVSVTYTYEEEQESEAPAPLLRHGYVVPLAADDDLLGHLAAFSRSGGLDDARADLESLARHAAPVLANARRFREARRLADLDALTGLHNRRYFHETLAREVARARRYERTLALIVLDVDDFKGVNDRIGHLAGDEVLAQIAERVRSAVRTSDVACRVGGDEFAVILPESGLDDGDQLYERIVSAVSSSPIGRAGLLRLSAGVTELRRGDEATTLFERADAALYSAKDAGKATVVAVPAPPDTASGSG